MKGIIRQLADTGDEIYAKLCKVKAINQAEKTITVEPLDGSAEVQDVLLIIDKDKKGLYIEPIVGSVVQIIFLSKEMAIIAAQSEIKEWNLQMDKTQMKIDKEGFLLKKDNETLKKIMVDLLDAIKKMKFQTNTGVTLQLLNLQEFENVENRLKDFLQ